MLAPEERIRFMEDLAARMQERGVPNPRREIAHGVGVDHNAVNGWFEGAKIRDDNWARLTKFARVYGIEPITYRHPPRIWDSDRCYAASVTAPPPLGYIHAATLENGVEFLGCRLGMPFGASSGPLTAQPESARYLLSTGIGFLETKTFLPVARSPHPPRNYLFGPGRLLLNPSSLQPGVRPDVVFTGFSRGGSRPTDGLGTHLGAPSPHPTSWIADVRRILELAQERCPVFVSIAADRDASCGREALLDRYDRVASMAVEEAGAKFITLNPRCPSLSVAVDDDLLIEIIRTVRRRAKGAIVALKLGYMSPESLKALLLRIGAEIDVLTLIGPLSITPKIPDQHGALQPAWVSGTTVLSGSPLLPFGLECVQTANRMRQEHSELRNLKLIGVGGVSCPEDVERYLASGADLVAAQTRLLENPDFALSVGQHLLKRFLASQDRQRAARIAFYRSVVEAVDMVLADCGPITLADTVPAVAALMSEHLAQFQAGPHRAGSFGPPPPEELARQIDKRRRAR